MDGSWGDDDDDDSEDGLDCLSGRMDAGWAEGGGKYDDNEFGLEE